MKAFIPALFVCTALLSCAASAQETQSIVQAKAAASSWLALVDAGNYSGSWDHASNLFKSAVNETAWVSAISTARTPLGKLKSREVRSANFTHTLPGAPDGDYVVIKYASQFENKAGAIETVTPMREKNGAWRVSGYFVK